MAGRKRATPGSSRSTAASGSSQRRTRAAAGHDILPDVYRQMLSEADVRSAPESPERPPKRRRPGQRKEPTKTSTSTSTVPAPVPEPISNLGATEDEEDVEFEDVGLPTPNMQTLYRDSDESDDEDDELQFEDVDFSFPESNADQPQHAPKEIQLDFTSRLKANPRHVVDRRKPITKSEKDRRVEIHKTHLLCLLSHVSRRNRWCNDAVVQENLRKLLTQKMITFLNPGAHLSQFGQTESLKNGLKQVGAMFKQQYKITERGLRRALWAEDEEHLQNYKIPDDAESPMEKSDFHDAAKSFQGSRDVGAQLCCALLRSAGVEARLVCSLQPLTFVSGGPSMAKPPKSKKTLSLEEQYARRPKYDSTFESPGISLSPLSARRRLGHPNAAAFEPPPMNSLIASRHAQDAPKKIRECSFPVYWVEVLDVGHQKWQPVDPLVTQSFWKAQKFEPPSNERDNCMTYVVGFEADGTAKDVTRRYTKAYNAKTRKMRIESVMVNGDKWWRKALRTYNRGYTTDLDQIEKNELTAAEAREPMPRNVADFKDHPVYALERHLRRNEVLVPGASVSGTVGAGSKGPLEKIYRRKDVRVARTQDKWYRLGREVAAGETPVKFLPKSVKKQKDIFDDEDADDVEENMDGTPIFTMEQTDLCKAPPVVNGIIPKNRYGNLDIFVPSMVPEGGAYVAEEFGAHAAYTLGIDYAPALTGFQFKGRHGTAVLHGVIVAAEHEEAVRAVIGGLKDREGEMEEESRRREVLRMWKWFLMNLRVRKRIWAGVDEDDEARQAETKLDKGKGLMDEDDEVDEAPQSDESDCGGGGFVVDNGDDYPGAGF